MSGIDLEITPTDDDDIEEDLFEEYSALEQAMVSEERQNEGTFLTGGNTRAFVELQAELALDENVILNPRPVKDGQELLNFLNANLHEFESPYAYIGGEANSPDKDRFDSAEVKILIARLSTYESVSLSMSHSLMAQIYGELPYTFCDLTYLPKPLDYRRFRENSFPIWFGNATKFAADKFDLLSITHAVSMEQLNFVACLHDSGIPLFKNQRMEREDIPLIVVGGANSGTTAPLSGEFTDSKGNSYAHFVDAVIYGDGEESAKKLVELIAEGKKKGLSKKEILRSCHGEVKGFYEPDCYVHEYDGKGSITEIRRAEGCDYAQFPVPRSTVQDLDKVRTLETKILPFTGDGASVDVAIAGSVGCIGSGGWGACSFCREGSEGPYRERSLDQVMSALDAATRNQGTKEVSFFSLNFNQYGDLFPLVDQSVKKGYKVGLISQRIDMLAETPEQIKVQRWLKKSNFTLGVEGISSRTRAYLNKNLQEWEILLCASEMMKEGAGELKFFQIVTGLEQEVDVDEFCSLMEKVNAIRAKLGASTRFRVSFTPLFPSAFTALQFAPANAAIKHGERSLDRLFSRAKELGWGRRLSVSGEEPLVSNTINQGGRNITPLLLKSHFQDDFRFYGNVPKGTWARWKRRAEADPNVNLKLLWGEKSFEWIFPWEDIAYSTSKEVLWRGYMKAVAFQGVTYCLSTRTIKGVCHVNECGACDPDRTGVPNKELMKKIVGRRVAPTISPEEMEKYAKSREKAYHVRVLHRTFEPITRYIQKNYYLYEIARSLMHASDKFNDLFIGAIGHARIAAGANMMRDWTYGYNIYDFAISGYIPESEMEETIVRANEFLREGEIVNVRVDKHLTILRKNVDFAVYTLEVKNSIIAYQRIRQDIENYVERRNTGKQSIIKKRVTSGKGVFETQEFNLENDDVRNISYTFVPERRSTFVRMVVKATHNPMSMLEAITKRRANHFKSIPVYCNGYVHLPEDTGEVDIFAALAGSDQKCKITGQTLEIDLFTGQPLGSGVSLNAPEGMDQNYPLDFDLFDSRKFEMFGSQAA